MPLTRRGETPGKSRRFQDPGGNADPVAGEAFGPRVLTALRAACEPLAERSPLPCRALSEPSVCSAVAEAPGGRRPRGSVWERRPEAAWTAREPFLQQSGARRSLRPANAAPRTSGHAPKSAGRFQPQPRPRPGPGCSPQRNGAVARTTCGSERARLRPPHPALCPLGSSGPARPDEGAQPRPSRHPPHPLALSSLSLRDLCHESVARAVTALTVPLPEGPWPPLRRGLQVDHGTRAVATLPNSSPLRECSQGPWMRRRRPFYESSVQNKDRSKDHPAMESPRGR